MWQSMQNKFVEHMPHACCTTVRQWQFMTDDASCRVFASQRFLAVSVVVAVAAAAAAAT